MNFVRRLTGLLALQIYFAGATIVVSGARSVTNGTSSSLPVRQNIDDLQQTGPMWDLYILALRRFADSNQSDPLSHYQVSGIHGLPFEPWDEVSGENASGYCAHNSILFGPWHRAYLALVEQIISTHARDIAMLYPTDLSAVYTAAARELRIPYWDWANSTTMPDIVTIPQIEIQGPEGMQRIQNPLYSYTFESDDLGTTLPSRFFLSRFTETFRGPNRNGVNQFNAVNAQLSAVETSLRERTYLLLSQQSHYAPFSNQGYTGPLREGFLDSVEGLHNQIHGLLGGHMASVPFAAFDPIFWLHHTNLDRLEALWQAIYPRSYVVPQINRVGNYITDPGTVETNETALYPFRKSGNTFHTSQDVREISSLGYTYPEIRDVGLDPTELSAEVRAIVRALYERNAVSRLERRATPYNLTASQEETAFATYEAWFLNVRANRQMIPESFIINFFFGGTPSQYILWPIATNRAGTHVVFAGDGDLSTWAYDMGQIPLNRQLKEQTYGTELISFKKSDVVNYLRNILNWQVLTTSGFEVDYCALECLKITVGYRHVLGFNATIGAPVYGELIEVLELN